MNRFDHNRKSRLDGAKYTSSVDEFLTSQEANVEKSDEDVVFCW